MSDTPKQLAHDAGVHIGYLLGTVAGNAEAERHAAALSELTRRMALRLADAEADAKADSDLIATLNGYLQRVEAEGNTKRASDLEVLQHIDDVLNDWRSNVDLPPVLKAITWLDQIYRIVHHSSLDGAAGIVRQVATVLNEYRAPVMVYEATAPQPPLKQCVDCGAPPMRGDVRCKPCNDLLTEEVPS